MHIAIIADIHDNIANLKKCLDWCLTNKIEKIIACGDITNIETIGYLSSRFPGDIFLVNGNADLYEDTELSRYSNIKYSGEIGLREIGGLSIGFCHEPEKISRVFKLAPYTPDFIFYGHTHKPWLEQDGGTAIVNPGNIAGIFHQGTFAILDSTHKKLDLKVIANLL